MDHFPQVDSFERRHALDGIRGVLVVLVVLYHFGIPEFDKGFIAVDSFFVISGFVISSILLCEMKKTKTLSFAGFYARRMTRLLPASLLVILTSCIVYRSLYTDYMLNRNKGSFTSAATFWENFYLIQNDKDYFGANSDETPLMHYWSLAIEEQFYFIFPILLVISMKLVSYNRRRLMILISIIISFLLYYQYLCIDKVPRSVLYFGTEFRIYQLLFGVLTSIWATERTKTEKSSNPRIAGIFTGLCVLFILVLSTNIFQTENFSFLGFVATVLTVGFIVGMEIDKNSYTCKLLSTQIFQFLGKYSYGIYLYHYPLLLFTISLRCRNFFLYIEVIICSIACAFVTWKYFENPVKQMKKKYSDYTTILIGLFAILIVTGAVHTINYTEHTSTKDPSVRLPGGAEEIMYYSCGDSHAYEWRLAVTDIADRRNIKFSSFFSYGVPWILDVDFRDKSGIPIPDRDRMEEFWKIMFVDNDNDNVVFLSTLSLLELNIATAGSMIEPGTAEWQDFLFEKIKTQIDPFMKRSRFVAIETHVVPRLSLLFCLGGRLEDGCENRDFPADKFENSKEFTEVLHDLHALYKDRFEVINIDEIICPGGICHVYENEIQTFKDTIHITDEYAVALSHKLEQILEPYLE